MLLIYKYILLFFFLDNNLPDCSTAITLIESDVDRITAALININKCWAQAIEVIVRIIILVYQIRWVCVMSVVFIISKQYL